MNTVDNFVEPRVKNIRITEDEIIAYLVDGRTISVPLTWSWRLSEATPEQRSNFEIIGDGYSIHWPDIDEDISVEGMLYGIPARRPKHDYLHVSNVSAGT
jgi:predicted dehydrogenase